MALPTNFISPDVLSSDQKQLVSEISKAQYDIPDIIVELLVRRGISNISELEKIYPDLCNIDQKNIVTGDQKVSNFIKLSGLDKFSKLIEAGMSTKTPIIIFGDYDVDGMAATSLLWRFLYRSIGYKNVYPLLPDREKHGYGLNYQLVEEKLNKVLKNDLDASALMVTVDCGIRDAEVIDKLKKKFTALKVIVTDHHQPPEESQKEISVPTAELTIHPQIADKNFYPREICGTAVVFAIVNFMNRVKQPSDIPDLGLGITALATVCDLMPLVGINRLIVQKGLHVLNKYASSHTSKQDYQQHWITGINAILKLEKLTDTKIASYHLGFVVGPKLNAAGRISDPIWGLRLLASDNPQTTDEIAVKLSELNQQRKTETDQALQDAEIQIKTQTEGMTILLVQNKSWSEGIVGLVAGKLLEKYHLPVIAFSQNRDGNWVGSARSINSINITEILESHASYLEKFGGHAQAAGMTIKSEQFNKFKSAITNYCDQHINQKSLYRDVKIDLKLSAKYIGNHTVTELSILEPTGLSNPGVKFLFEEKIETVSWIGKNSTHLKAICCSNPKLEILIFNFSEIYPQKVHNLSLICNQPWRFIGKITENRWRDKHTTQVIVSHILSIGKLYLSEQAHETVVKQT